MTPDIAGFADLIGEVAKPAAPTKLSLEELQAVVPSPLREKRRWCGFFASKAPRNLRTGNFARVNEPSTWGTYEEACAYYQKHQARPDAGIGFVTGDGIGALDFDDARDPDTGEAREWARPTIEAAMAATYTEVSPSGRGYRCLVSDVDGMIEYHEGKPPSSPKLRQFVRLTGWRQGPVGELAPLPEELRAPIDRRDTTAPAEPAADAPVDLAVVESALEKLDPDTSYKEWLEVGFALHHGLGPQGLEVWDRWSASDGSTKYRHGECAERWKSFKGRGISIDSLFYLARKAGWRDPRDPAPEQEFTRNDELAVAVAPMLLGALPAREEAGPLSELTHAGILFRYDPKKKITKVDKTALNVERALAYLYEDHLELDTRAGAIVLDGRRLEDGTERNALSAGLVRFLDWDADPAPHTLRAGLLGAATRRGFDPVVRYLDRLQAWDATPRFLELARAMGAAGEGKDLEYTADLLARWCMGAVRRAREPGCQFDTALVLHGAQGLKKSGVLRALAEVVPNPATPLFQRASARIKDKDGRMALQGPWVVELAELTQIRTAEQEFVRAFVDERHDWYRPPYGEVFASRPRRIALAGTSNETEFLSDTAGNRRWWPVRVERRIDLEWVVENRDRLWAEASTRAARGEAHWYEETPGWLLQRHEAAQEEGALEEAVEDTVERQGEEWRARGYFRLADVRFSLPSELLRGNQLDRAIGGKLRRMGFVKERQRVGDGPSKVWRRPEWPTPKATARALPPFLQEGD
jgi:hypothetical protein